MGNSNAKEIQEQKLLVKNRLLQNQIGQLEHVDPVTKNSIEDVKKNRKYTNLVLSGGAIKGVAYVGVLEYLHNNRYLSNIKNISCSSVGSIFGTMYALGYTISELKHIAETIDFKRIAEVNKDLVSDIYHIATEYGLNNGQFLIDTVTELIEKRTGNKNYTLEQLWKEKGINLVITATDITTGNTIYFWHGDYPKMPLRLLVRISCSVPGLFCPVIFDGHYLVDGGLLDNIPIHVFDGDTPNDRNAKLNLTPVNPYTLAILLVGDLNTIGNPNEQSDIAMQPTKPFSNKIGGVFSYFNAVIDTLIDNGEQRYMRPSFWLRTIPVQDRKSVV